MASRSHSGPADGPTVALLRARVHDWLNTTVAISVERASDIVLAANEALSNCAEHAYRGHSAAGTMTLTLIYDPDHAVIEILTTDDGHWIEPSDPTVGGMRGRGLPLMKLLSDACVVDGHSQGTTIRMRFGECPAQNESAVQAN